MARQTSPNGILQYVPDYDQSQFVVTKDMLKAITLPLPTCSGDRRMRSDVRAPLAFGPDSNPDPRPPRNLVRGRQPSIFDVQPSSAQVGPVLGQRDPHRHREIAWTATEFMRRHLRFLPRATAFHAPCATALHHVNPLERLERTNQHRGRRSNRLGHRVDQRMNAVIEVDVREARRTVERRVA
jgi:hypothetical protein